MPVGAMADAAKAPALIAGEPQSDAPCDSMIRLSSFTSRMWLILAHDLLVTAGAILASFFIRS